VVLAIVLGVSLGIVVNVPAIVYVVWSRALLKRHVAAGTDRYVVLRRVEVCLRVLFGAATVGLVWPIVSSAVGGFAILATYGAVGERLGVTEFLIAVGFWPDTIASWIAGLRDLAAYFDVGSLHWAVVTGLVMVVLLAISLFQRLLIRSRYGISIGYDASRSA
jgi:hypothetical protein